MGTQNETNFDALLYSIADEANDAIDYDAMLDAIRKKANARKRINTIVKYGSIAAAFIVLAAVGSIWLRISSVSDSSCNEAMPQEAYLNGMADAAPESADYNVESEIVAANEDTARSAVTSEATEGNLYSASGSEPDSKGTNDLSSSMAYIEYYMLGTIELPTIDFGTSVEAVDGNNLAYTVYGCTNEDMENYLIAIAELHSAEYDIGAMRVTLEDGQVISLVLNDGTMTIALED